MSRSSPASGSSPAARPRPGAAPAAGAGFARSARLLKHSDFDHVYRNGRKHFSGNLAAFYLARPGAEAGAAGGPRVGLTVSRALGGAVQRNRIRRRLREAIRLRLHELAGPVDVVFNPRKSVLKMEFPELMDEVGRAFAAVRKGGGRAAGERA